MASARQLKNARWLCSCGSTTPWRELEDDDWTRYASVSYPQPVCDNDKCNAFMARVSWHCATLDEALGCATCIAVMNMDRADATLEKIGMPNPAPAVAAPMTILEEAGSLVNQGGDRNDAYDHPYHNFSKIAAVAEIVFGVKATPRQVGLFMIGMKMVRDSHKARRDNIVDIAGYARCIERLEELATPAVD